MKKILFAGLLLLLACHKKNEDPTPTNTSTNQLELSATKYKPGEVVIADANFTPSKTDSTTINVNGIDVHVGVNSIDQVVFVMPVLPAGPVTIDYTNIGGPKVTTSVDSYSPITAPDAVLTSYISDIDNIISGLNEAVNDTITNMDQDNIEILNYLKQTLQTNYNSLSNEEKIQLAYVLQNNTPDPASFGLGDRSSNQYARLAALSLEPSERLIQVKNKFAGNVIKGVALTASGLALATVPSPVLFDKVVAVGLLTSGFCYLAEAGNNIKEIGRIIGVFGDEVTDYSPKLAASVSTEMVLFKDANKKVSFKGNYRTLLKSDSTSSAPVLAAIFSSKKKFDKTYNNISSLLNKIKGWFLGNAPAVPAKPDPIRTNAYTKKFALNAKNIVINNVSNSNIQVLYTKNDTTITITAKSTTVTTETPFTFNVVYTDPNFSKTVTQTIKAVFKPQRSGVTVAGGNGEGSAANQLGNPSDIWVDASGNIYIVDAYSRIQKWAPGATSGQTVINNPMEIGQGIYGLAVDGSGNIYISDNKVVQKWAPGATKPDTVYSGNPAHITFANGYLYVADAYQRIYKVIDKNNKILLLSDTQDDPSAIFVDANENIYLAYYSWHYVQKYPAGSATGVTVAGTRGSEGGETDTELLKSPRRIWVDSKGYLYVIDYTFCVKRFAPGTTSSVRVAGKSSDGDYENSVDPYGLFVDSQGNIYLSDQMKDKVDKWPPYVD